MTAADATAGPAAIGARSYLYVPGDRPDRIATAIASPADAVVIDLEDAVAVAAKDAARTNATRVLAEAPADGTEVWVRVNQGARGMEDLAAIASLPGLTGAFVPKATAVGVIAPLGALRPRPAVALVESAEAVLQLPSLAVRDGVVALAMGEVDLAADLGVETSPDGRELWPLRTQVVVASAAAGLRPPIAPVWVDVGDLDGLAATSEALRRRGFGARQAVHPSQVPVINEVFTPAPEAVAAARELLAGAEATDAGVWTTPDGTMVDEAVLRSARRTVALAERWAP